MKATTAVSTTFAATHDRHQVNLLVTLSADAPAARPPVNVALVLDRSGSMAGEPLAHARDAAVRFAGFLTGHDRLTVVAFDDEVRLLFGPGPGNDPAAIHAIRTIQSGGQTNLSGGWLEGHRDVSRGMVEGTNRVLLLTDGQANRGVISPAELEAMTGGAARQGTSTTCVGFGPHFNEDLLRGMSNAGGGHFWYVESVDQMTGAFEGEIEGLVNLAAQNVTLTVTLTHPGVAGVTIVPPLATQHNADGWRVSLGDLYAVQPRSVGLTFHVENAPELFGVQLGEVRLAADILRPDGIEHRTITLPVMATLDGQDHIVPEVEATFLRFRVAQAREEAVRLADAGDTGNAARILREAATALAGYAADSPLGEAREDLLAESERIGASLYDPADRKYHLARSMMARDGREHHEAKLSRRRRP